MARRSPAEYVCNRHHQPLRSNWLAHLFALAARAVSLGVSAIDDEWDVSRVQPVADLGAVTISKAMIKDGSRKVRRLNFIQGITERSGRRHRRARGLKALPNIHRDERLVLNNED